MYIRWWTLVKVWIAYLLPFAPFLPKIGDERDIDCILGQSFGRNAMADKSLGLIVGSLRGAANDGDTGTFALLQKRGFDPGKTNRVLAWYCITQFVNRLGIPLIVQWEIAYAMWKIDPVWYNEQQYFIDCLWPPEQGYFSVYHVGVLAKEQMYKRGCRSPLEVAHPAMAARVILILWKLGIMPVANSLPLWKFWSHPLWVWDENSVQDWTKNFIPLWLKREIPTRPAMFWYRWASLIPPRASEKSDKLLQEG